MNKKIITVFLLFSLNALAYFPSAESLLRNGSNVDIGNSTVVGVLNIKRTMATEELGNIPQQSAIKVLFGNEDTDKTKFIQLDYKNGIVSNATLNKIHYKNIFSLKRLGLLESRQLEAAAFYSVLTSLMNNSSKLFMELFREIDPSIKSNRELVNKDQEGLLRQYKYYLTKMADEDHSDDLANPLKPETPEAMERVKEILRAPYLVSDGVVKRVREKNNFYWDVKGSTVYARFDGENHRLKKVIITTSEGKIEIDCYNYILFNGKLEFPEVIYFKDLSGQIYEIQMAKLYLINDVPGAFTRRLQNYEKTLQKNNDKEAEIVKPSFLL